MNKSEAEHLKVEAELTEALAQIEKLEAALKEIAVTCKRSDTGERQYKMNDYEYCLKQSEKALSSLAAWKKARDL